jgi:histidinol-phosphate aminotransferase
MGLHRYPDPHQIELKQRFCNLRNDKSSPYPPITSENLFLGVGSDECIDALLRCFCAPGKEKILTCPPTYGMYSVSACVNDLEVVKVPLETASGKFGVDVETVMSKLSEDPTIKLVYLCSPGNPTGALVSPAAVETILNHHTWNGVVIVDEAYIDFSAPGSSLAPWVTGHQNLVVMQTLSKAFGLAGIRLGAAFTSPGIATLLNSLKAPYSISSPTSALATVALAPKGLAVKDRNVGLIKTQRERLLEELPKIPGVGRFLGGKDSNFLLVEMLDGPGGKPDNKVAQKVYVRMAETKAVVVRFRGKEYGCEGCLRITVGTEEENTVMLKRLTEVLEDIIHSDT